MDGWREGENCGRLFYNSWHIHDGWGAVDIFGGAVEKPTDDAAKKMSIFERRAKADAIVPECAGMGTSSTLPLILHSPAPPNVNAL
jgi:hypothetical protein